MKQGLPLLLLAAALLGVALLAGRGEIAPPAAPDATPAPNADSGAAAPAPAVAAAPAARVSGFVRRDSGPRAARVRVWSIPAENIYGENELLAPVPGGDPVTETASDADGRFELGDLPAGNYRLIAETDDGAFGTIDFALRAPLGQETVTVPVRGGGPCELRGVAVREDGTPFRGFLLAGRERRPAPTDEEGRFVLAGLPAGVVPLVAVEPGRRSVDAGAARVPADGEFRLVIGSGDQTYSGTVVADADGTPVEGVAVDVTVWAPRWMGSDTVRTRTGPDGTFSVRVAPGEPSVRLSKPGWRSVEGHPETNDPLVWRMERAGGVTGRVVAAADGRPLAGVPVHAISWRDVSGEEEVGTTVTDAAGRFAFDGIRDPAVFLYARGAGWCSRELPGDFHGGALALVRELPAGGAVDVELAVVPSFRIRGRVTDAAGAAAAEERVRTRFQLQGEYLDVSAVTGPDGHFSIDLVPGRKQDLSVGSGWGPERLSGASGEERKIEIRLPPERWIGLELVRADTGKPVADANVEISARPGPEWRTGPDGRVRLVPLARGEIELRVERAGLRLARPIRLPADATGVTVRAVMVPSDGPSGLLPGRLVVPGGRRIRDGRVEGAQRSSPVAADGSFELRGLPEGSLILRAIASAGGRFWLGGARERVPGPDAVVEMHEEPEPDRTVRVRVLDPEGRHVPLADLEAEYLGAAEEDEEPSRGSERRLVVGGEAVLFPMEEARTVSLLVFGAMSGTERRLEVGAVRHGPVGLPAEEIVVRLPRDRPITGRVVGTDGRGLPGIRVHAQHVEEWYLDSEAVSGPDGSFRLVGIGEGAYRLNADTPTGREFGCVEEPVVPAGTDGVELRMEEFEPREPREPPKPREVRGIVRDADGRPVAGAAIWAREFGHWFPKGDAFYDGTFRIRGRREEPIDVLALPPGERPEEWLGKATRTGADATAVVLPYRPANAIVLTVDGWSGGRLDRRVAVFRADEKEPRRVSIDEDGRVRLAGLPADESVDVGCAPLVDGRAFYVEGVTGKSGRVRASLVPCPVIRVRPVLPPGVGIHHVHALGFGTIVSGDPVDGRVDVRVTLGRSWTVVVGAQIDGKVVERRVDARGGETVRPDFTK